LKTTALEAQGLWGWSSGGRNRFQRVTSG